MNLIQTTCPGNQILTTKRYLLPPTLNTTLSLSAALSNTNCLLMSIIVFHSDLLTSANHARSGPSASGCFRQNSRRVPRLRIRIRCLTQLTLFPFWEQGHAPRMGPHSSAVGTGATSDEGHVPTRPKGCARRGPGSQRGSREPPHSRVHRG